MIVLVSDCCWRGNRSYVLIKFDRKVFSDSIAFKWKVRDLYLSYWQKGLQALNCLLLVVD